MNTTNPTFFTEINSEITKLSEEAVKIQKEIANLKEDTTAYHSHLHANKDYYNLLVKKFEVALKKAKFEAIRDGKEYNFKRFIRPVYLHKIGQFRMFAANAPGRLNL